MRWWAVISVATIWIVVFQHALAEEVQGDGATTLPEPVEAGQGRPVGDRVSPVAASAPLPPPRAFGSAKRPFEQMTGRDGTSSGSVAEIMRARLAEAVRLGFVIPRTATSENEKEDAPDGEGRAPRPAPVWAGPSHEVSDANILLDVAETAPDTSPAFALSEPPTLQPPLSRPDSVSEPLTPVLSSQSSCIPDESLRLPISLDARTAFSEAERIKADLLDALDRPDPSRALGLARLYLSIGLAPEALAVLAEFVPDPRDARPLAEIARLLDGRDVGEGVFGASECGGLHGLWRGFALALRGQNAQAVSEARNSRRAFEGLSRHLRAQISEKFLSAAVKEKLIREATWFMAMRERSRSDHHLATQPASRATPLAAPELEPVVVVLDRLKIMPASAQPSAETVDQLARAAMTNPFMLLAARPGLTEELGATALIARGAAQGEAAFLAEASLLAARDGVGAAHSLLAHGLARGLLSPDSYAAALERVGREWAAPSPVRPLALLHDEAPEQFDLAMQYSGFRKALAISYAQLGAPDIVTEIVTRGDAADQVFLAQLARESSGVGTLRFDAWLDAARREADRAAAPADAGKRASAEPSRREPTETISSEPPPQPRPDRALPRGQLDSLAQGAVTAVDPDETFRAIDEDIAAFRKVLSDG